MRHGLSRESKKGLIGPFPAQSRTMAENLDDVLAHGLQALGTQLHRYKLAILEDLGLLNVRLELTLGMPLGKADIVPKLGFLTTSFANSHGGHHL
jgi:hypothetical protein